MDGDQDAIMLAKEHIPGRQSALLKGLHLYFTQELKCGYVITSPPPGKTANVNDLDYALPDNVILNARHLAAGLTLALLRNSGQLFGVAIYPAAAWGKSPTEVTEDGHRSVHMGTDLYVSDRIYPAKLEITPQHGQQSVHEIDYMSGYKMRYLKDRVKKGNIINLSLAIGKADFIEYIEGSIYLRPEIRLLKYFLEMAYFRGRKKLSDKEQEKLASAEKHWREAWYDIFFRQQGNKEGALAETLVKVDDFLDLQVKQNYIDNNTQKMNLEYDIAKMAVKDFNITINREIPSDDDLKALVLGSGGD